MEVAPSQCSSLPRDEPLHSRDDPSPLPLTDIEIESISPDSELSPEHSTIDHFRTTDSTTSVEGGHVLCELETDVAQTSTVTLPSAFSPPPLEAPTNTLTAEFLEEQNKLMGVSTDTPVSAIRAWAANLPEIPDDIQPEPTGPSHIFELQPSTEPDKEQPRIQETKDVFTESQKVAYVGLCALTSLEVVHDYRGKEFTYARMSSDNWQRKVMRMVYMHMDISPEEIKMIESLSKHSIVPSDLVHQFTAQGETTTVNMEGFQEVKQADNASASSSCISEEEKSKESESIKDSSSTTNTTRQTGDSPRATLSGEEKPSPRNSTAAKTIYDAGNPTNQFVIDLRWTVMCDLLLLFLGTENFDARSRVFITRIASYLDLDWLKVIGFEKRITDQLISNASLAWETETVTTIASSMTTATNMEVSIRNETEKKTRNKERRKRRYVMIGLATIGGGLILGLSAGLMAPIIAGGLGTILTTVGVSGATSFLGGTTGIALITGAATSIGSGMGAKGMRRRMKTINTFEFFPVQIDERVNCVITISGWLPKKGIKDLAALPFSTLDPIMGDHYTLYWEPEMLEDLGSAFKIFATEVVTFSIQQALAHTIMSALLAGLAWPLALTKLGYLVDNPWHNGLDRSRLAGLILADSIMNRNLGARPITLVGYSLGARVIFYCLLELARMNAYGLVENVTLFGTPVSASRAQWSECTSVVAGRFINGYATNDWLLGFLFRASTAGLGNVAGLHSIQGIDGDRIQNVDCTDLVKGHLSYRTAMPKLLKRAGFVVTSDELPDSVKRDEEEDEEFVLDLSGSKDLEQFRPATMTKGSSVSSLKSGKASIQYPPPKTKCNPHQLGEEEPSRADTPIEDPVTTNTAEEQVSFPISSRPKEEEKPVVIDASRSSSPPPPAVHKEHTRTTTPDIPDDEIIAEIIAKATAVSKSPGQYSSLSSGSASIAQPFSPAISSSPPLTEPSSDTSTSSRSIDEPTIAAANRKSMSSSSLFSKSSSLFKLRKKSADDISQRELTKAGIEVKEIKSTLGRMVVPDEVVNPIPKFSLEKPQYARVNR